MVLLALPSRLQPGELHLSYSHVCQESIHSREFFDGSVLAKLNLLRLAALLGHEQPTTVLSEFTSKTSRCHHHTGRLSAQKILDVLHHTQQTVAHYLRGLAGIVGREHDIGQSQQRVAGLSGFLVKNIQPG